MHGSQIRAVRFFRVGPRPKHGAQLDFATRSRSATRPNHVWRDVTSPLMRRLAFEGAAFFQVYLPDMADGCRQQIAPLVFRTLQD
jgi:hypothetical protein